MSQCRKGLYGIKFTKFEFYQFFLEKKNLTKMNMQNYLCVLNIRYTKPTVKKEINSIDVKYLCMLFDVLKK